MNSTRRSAAVEKLRLSLESFVEGPDRSLTAARGIESQITTQFPELNPIQELADWLAQYRPGGGDGLFAEPEAIVEFTKWLRRTDWQNPQVN